MNFIIKGVTSSFIMFTAWSQERDRNISKTCAFIFYHSVQRDEACGYTFYNNNYLTKR